MGVIAASGGVGVLDRTWRDCEIGINAAANFWSLIPIFVALWAAAALIWAMAFGALGGRSLVLATVVAALGTLGMYWALMAGWRAPDGYPVSVSSCFPDNVPPWWPKWLPV
ncbi:hypothetical protein [Streptomyces sp. NPDC001070]